MKRLDLRILFLGVALLVPTAVSADPKQVDVSGGFFSKGAGSPAPAPKQELRQDKYGNPVLPADPAVQMPEQVDGAIQDTTGMFELPSQRPTQNLHTESGGKTDEEKKIEKVVNEVKKKLDKEKQKHYGAD